jgi:uncharacterized protein YdaU (DUF1376 family)
MGSLRVDIFMPIFIGDLLADTQHLTDEQFGKYHKILYHQWRQGHLSEEDLWGVCGFSGPLFESASSSAQEELKQAFSRVLAPIMQMLSKDDEGRWFSRRCDVEKFKWTEKKRVFIERARKGGLAKAKRRREALANSGSENPASSSSSRVLEGVLESCTSPSPSPVEEQKQKQKPSAGSPSSPSSGGDAHARPKLEKRPAGAPSKPGEGEGRPEPMRGQEEGLQGLQQAIPKGVSPSKNGHSSDSRHALFKQEVFAYWSGQNPDAGELTWSASDGKALQDLLQAAPKMSIGEFRSLLQARAHSDVNPADLPRTWLRDVKKFAAGPLDRFGKPLRAGRRL